MSQIRRICRLIVEWDDTSSKKPPPKVVEEEDPPPKPQRTGFYMGGTRYYNYRLLESFSSWKYIHVFC